MFQTKGAEKIKTHVLCAVTFFWKSCCLWNNAWKYDIARHATDDNIIRHMCITGWIIKATDTHTEYVIIFVCHGNNASCYIICTLPAMFSWYFCPFSGTYSSLYPTKCNASPIMYALLLQHSYHNAICLMGSPQVSDILLSNNLHFHTL
jgi:hypothetical protein